MNKRLGIVVLIAGCGTPPVALGVDSGNGGHADVAPADSWTTLVSRDWASTPGFEGYRCSRIQITEDLWITGFRALSPTGTHHEVVTLEDSLPAGGQVGDYDCSAGANIVDLKMLYAAGIATDDLMFPDGVAVHVAPGQYVNVNIHLFNATDGDLAGNSGVQIKTIAPAAVVNEADMTFAGTLTISVPPDSAPHTAVGGCTAPTDWHMFTLWPHMHQTATHQLVTVTAGGTRSTLLDTAYSFTDQKNYPMAETVIHQGDQVEVTCTYVNDPAQFPPARTITFGDSSTAEMCFAGIYKWPAGGGEFGCVH